MGSVVSAVAASGNCTGEKIINVSSCEDEGERGGQGGVVGVGRGENHQAEGEESEEQIRKGAGGGNEDQFPCSRESLGVGAIAAAVADPGSDNDAKGAEFKGEERRVGSDGEERNIKSQGRARRRDGRIRGGEQP